MIQDPPLGVANGLHSTHSGIGPPKSTERKALPVGNNPHRPLAQKSMHSRPEAVGQAPNPGFSGPFHNAFPSMFTEDGKLQKGSTLASGGTEVEKPPIPTAGPSFHAFQTVPFFARNGKVAERPELAAAARQTPASVPSVDLRPCAGQFCDGTLPDSYPHLRCRRCRLSNVPRRPELRGILTSAQFAELGGIPQQDTTRENLTMTPPMSASSFPSQAFLPSPPGPPPLAVTIPQSILRSFAPTSQPPVYPVTVKAEPVEVCLNEPLAAVSTPLDGQRGESGSDVDPAIEDLEFMYPEPDGAEEPVSEPLPSTPANNFEYAPASHTHTERIEEASQEQSHKRRKVSHPGPLFATASLPSKPSLDISAAAPRQPVPEQGHKCSTPDCANVLSGPTSFGPARCSSCILRDWKSKKAKAAEIATQKQRRKVSFAPDVVETVEQEEQQEAQSEQEAEDSPTSPMEGVEEAPANGQPADATPSTQTDKPKLKIKLDFSKLQPRFAPNHGWDSGLSDSSDRSPSDSEIRNEDPDAKIEAGGGGSSGSETAGAVVSSEDDKTAATQRQPASGLKIRIPPPSLPIRQAETDSPFSATPLNPLRPPSLEAAKILAGGGRWCSNYLKCRQVLHREYQWKSCVLCRARTRQYQRKRQNLQTSHKHLDDELALFQARRVTPGEAKGSNSPKLGSTAPSADSPRATEHSDLQPTSPSQEPGGPAGDADEVSPRDDDTEEGKTTVATADISGLGEAPPKLVPGARLCSVKQCHQMLPPPDEYEGRMCSQCRQRCKDNRRRQQRVRAGQPLEEIPFDYAPWLPCLEDDDKRENGRCRSIDCGMLIDPKMPFAYCLQCRHRAIRSIKKGMKKEGKSSKEIFGFVQEISARQAKQQLGMAVSRLSIRVPSLKQKQVKPQRREETPYPEYKCLAALLENLRKLSRDFFEAQIWHSASKCKEATDKIESLESEGGTSPSEGKDPSATPPSPDLIPSLFCFDGEFSVVAPDYDVASRRTHVEEVVFAIKKEAQEGANIKFGPKRWVSIFDYGVSTRFLCARECRLPRPPATPGAKPDVTTKLMHGELEVAVVIDKSHPFIPGERTVVRLRLIG